MQFRKKPVVIDAITFDQLVQHGRDNGANIVGGMPWWFSYKGHPISHENDECYLIPTKEGTMNFTPSDMLITGVQGEIYPCKLEIFAATYEPVIETKTYADSTTATGAAPLPDRSPTSFIDLTFGDALVALKGGAKVARAGWNGKGMFVYLVPANSYPAQTGAAKAFFGEGALVPYNAYFALKGVDGTVSTWAPSGSDALAEDWQFFE